MKTDVAIAYLLRRLPALLLAGMVMFVATGFTQACSDHHDEPEKTEHVLLCDCACHHHLQLPEFDPVRIEFNVIEIQSSSGDQNPLSNAELSGIFRPPQHLV